MSDYDIPLFCNMLILYLSLRTIQARLDQLWDEYERRKK